MAEAVVKNTPSRAAIQRPTSSDLPPDCGQPIDRRRLLGIGAAGMAALAAIPAAVRASETAPDVASREELLSRYIAWLHMECRLASMELYPDWRGASHFVPNNQIAKEFHFPHDRDWRDVPKPSARALPMLCAAGVSVAPEGGA